MTDFSTTYGDTGYYDGSYSSGVDTAVADGTTTAYGTSADYTADSSEASSASWEAWGNSLQADSYANEAWYAGDYEASAAWTSVGDGYEADSNAAYDASWTAWDASGDAYADESAAWDASYDTSYDTSSAGTDYTYDGYDTSYADTGSSYDYSSSYDTSSSYDYSSSYDSGSATDVVTDYYTSADW